MNTNQPSHGRVDVYAAVTAKIVGQLEQGVRPWNKPWSSTACGGSRPLRCNGLPYRGINVLMLWAEGETKGFTSPYWLTFKQALDLNAYVRKGEQGSIVVYADRFKRTDTGANGEAIEEEIPYLKVYSVFNAEQMAGLPQRYLAREIETRSGADRIAQAEAFTAATKAQIHHAGDGAFYAPGQDRIQIPSLAAFRDSQGYYATLLHELTHWTKHDQRLGRNLGGTRFGDAGYAREELVAEIGAAFLCAELGIALEPRQDHAEYLAQWLGVLREDKRAIFQAAAHAQRAADYLHQLQEPTNPVA